MLSIIFILSYKKFEAGRFRLMSNLNLIIVFRRLIFSTPKLVLC